MMLADLRELASAATPGPWEWYGHTDGDVYLSTMSGGRRFVLTVVDGQPAFQVYNDRDGDDMWRWSGLMTAAGQLPRNSFTYKSDMVGVDHPDATLIALAPDLALLCAEMAAALELASHANHRDWSPIDIEQAAVHALDKLAELEAR
jgi:hypothetical protein